jgi:glycogen phosphorylase
LLYHDPYLLLADYQSYIECQARVSEAYGDPDRWTRMSILNTARSGKFSSDRTIREYCDDIWQVKAVPIRLLTDEEAGIA